MARVYLYTGAFLLGGPPACWENGSRIYLYARYHNVQNQLRGVKGWNFWALTVCGVKMARALACVPPFAIFGANSRRGGNGARAYLCPPFCNSGH